VDRLFAPRAFPELRKLLQRIQTPPHMDPSQETDWANDPTSKAAPEKQQQLARAGGSSNLPARKPRQTFLLSATLTIAESGRGGRRKKKKPFLKRAQKIVGLRPSPLVADFTIVKKNPAQDNDDAEGDSGNGLKLPSSLDLRQIHCPDDDKDAHMYHFLHGCFSSARLSNKPCRVLIFANAISHIKRITLLLSLLKVPVHALHAKMQQRQRLKNLDRFRVQRQTVLVATDVAARGLDVAGIQYVLHYHLPRTVDLFVHRSGRTARANQKGLSLSIVSPQEHKLYASICTVLGMPDEGITPLPVDLLVMKQVHSRVNVAQKICKLQLQQSRQLSHVQWLQQSAQDMDMILDDDFQELVENITGSSERQGIAGEAQQQMKGLQQQLRGMLRYDFKAHRGMLSLFAHIQEADQADQADQELPSSPPKEKGEGGAEASVADDKKAQGQQTRLKPKAKKQKKKLFW